MRNHATSQSDKTKHDKKAVTNDYGKKLRTNKNIVSY